MEETTWQFVLHTDGVREAWTWRRTRIDGAPLEVSCDFHADYGKAVNDAIRHGFRPSHEPWAVINGNSVTHFLPDCRPPRPRGRKRAGPRTPASTSVRKS